MIANQETKGIFVGDYIYVWFSKLRAKMRNSNVPYVFFVTDLIARIPKRVNLSFHNTNLQVIFLVKNLQVIKDISECTGEYTHIRHTMGHT